MSGLMEPWCLCTLWPARSTYKRVIMASKTRAQKRKEQKRQARDKARRKESRLNSGGRRHGAKHFNELSREW